MSSLLSRPHGTWSRRVLVAAGLAGSIALIGPSRAGAVPRTGPPPASGTVEFKHLLKRAIRCEVTSGSCSAHYRTNAGAAALTLTPIKSAKSAPQQRTVKRVTLGATAGTAERRVRLGAGPWQVAWKTGAGVTVNRRICVQPSDAARSVTLVTMLGSCVESRNKCTRFPTVTRRIRADSRLGCSAVQR